MSADIDHLRALYGGAPTTNPKRGDIVTVTGLDGVFVVESYARALFTLRSEHGATLRAGCLAVRALESWETP